MSLIVLPLLGLFNIISNQLGMYCCICGCCEFYVCYYVQLRAVSVWDASERDHHCYSYYILIHKYRSRHSSSLLPHKSKWCTITLLYRQRGKLRFYYYTLTNIDILSSIRARYQKISVICHYYNFWHMSYGILCAYLYYVHTFIDYHFYCLTWLHYQL